MANAKAKVRVGINGYGVIGKRVADAVALQDDMELAGVSDIVHDYRTRVALERGIRVFASTAEKLEEMKTAGVPTSGTLEALLEQIDVIVDCTPKKIAAANRPIYEKGGIKAIYQGGEKHEVAGYSFVAQANYAGAIGRSSTRVVSCNTTGLTRVLGALHSRGLIKKARVVIIRRATDPWESHKEGMINTVIPETKVPSHQGPDAQTVIPDLSLTTMAGAASHNLIITGLVNFERESNGGSMVGSLPWWPAVSWSGWLRAGLMDLVSPGQEKRIDRSQQLNSTDAGFCAAACLAALRRAGKQV